MSTCLLDSKARLHLHGGRLTVQRPGSADSYLPLNQLERIVIRAPDDPVLQALIMLAEAGRPVHFISARGEPIATLTPHKPAPGLPAVGEQLINRLFRSPGNGAYRTWLDHQRSHTCSRLIRHSHSRDWPRVEAAVGRYLARVVNPPLLLKALVCELHGLLWAWLDARFQRLGLNDVAEVLDGRDCHLQTDLETLLALPLRSWMTPILRERPNAALDAGALFQLIENRLERRLWLHLNALSATLNVSAGIRRRNRK